MKRFLKFCCIFIIGLLVLFALAYLNRPKNSENYFAGINHKVKLLDSVPSPRIIFVGGSNVCFGIDSKTISDSIGLPVIDFGLHASAGLKFYLDLVSKKSRPSDIVIIMPELQQFYGEFNGESAQLSPLFLLCDDLYKKDIVKTLNTTQIINIIGGFPKALYDIYRSEKVKDAIYNAKGFNEFGDQNSHWYANQPEKWNDLTPIIKPIDNYAVRYVGENIKTVTDRGCVVFLFPPTITESYYKMEFDKFNELYLNFSSNGSEFSTAADAFAVYDEYCFDGIYHRDKRGVDVVSQKIIKELKKLYLSTDSLRY